MHTSASEQLAAIHAMMASGHRSVRLERHTLIVWGLAAAFLILSVKLIFTDDRFPVVWQRVVASHLFIVITLIAAGVWDVALTRRARRRRDETLPFVQAQLMKVWWLLVGLIVVLSFGMNFFGGGYMFYGVVLAIMGIAFYVHGLFSQQMLSWLGLALIVVGLASLALKLPFPIMEWLAVFVFAVGFPALAFLLERVAVNATVGRRLAWSGAWLSVVVLPTVVIALVPNTRGASELPLLTLAEYREIGSTHARAIVRLPPGTAVPAKIAITGDVLQAGTGGNVPLTLARTLDVIVENGKPVGFFRVDSGDWKDNTYGFRIRDVRLSALLPPTTGPEVGVALTLSTGN